MINLSRLPVGAKYLVLGLVVGAAYIVGMSSVWGFKVKSTESTRAARGSKASACTRGAIYQVAIAVYGVGYIVCIDAAVVVYPCRYGWC